MTSMQARFDRARQMLNKGDFFRILTHYDVDGVCSAGIIADYLRRNGKHFHVSFFRNGEQRDLIDEARKSDYVILTDLGSAIIKELSGNAIVLDHHNPPGDNEEVVHINPHLFGYDGSTEVTATTLSYMLVNDKRYAWCFFAGILGDKEYVPGKGPIGLNKEIMESLHIAPVFDFPFYGSLRDALFYSVQPFFPGISGKWDSIDHILKKLGLEKTKDVRALKEEEKVKLGSYLALNLIKNSKIPDAGKFIVDLDFVVDGMSVRYITELIDSACRTDNQSVALSYVFGDKEARDRMEVLRRDYLGKVIEELYSMLSGMLSTEHVQYFYAKSSYLASTVATIGSLYLLDPSKVTLAMHIDSEVTISARIHRSMMDKIDLSVIMKKVAGSLGGHGGGHSVAAGATVPRGKEEEFVNMVEEEVKKLLNK